MHWKTVTFAPMDVHTKCYAVAADKLVEHFQKAIHPTTREVRSSDLVTVSRCKLNWLHMSPGIFERVQISKFRQSNFILRFSK